MSAVWLSRIGVGETRLRARRFVLLGWHADLLKHYLQDGFVRFLELVGQQELADCRQRKAGEMVGVNSLELALEARGEAKMDGQSGFTHALAPCDEIS